jgi:hypothetical protein
MLQYAQDAMETDKPWERWESALPAFVWLELTGHPNWQTDRGYRRKPQTVKINGFEVPAPLSEVPNNDTEYFIEEPTADQFYDYAHWSGHSVDFRFLDRGIAHATKEGAIASCKARLGIDPEEK